MISQEVLQRVLNYDPETGAFTWVQTLGSRAQNGTPAGSRDQKGYLRVWLCGVNYKLHRLAFVWMTGSCQAAQIDHINQIKDDNRWVNLRAVTNAENQQNTSLRKDSKTGFTGVTCFGRAQYRATIRKDGTLYHLGLFDRPEDASEAYLAAKQRLHTFACSGGVV